MDARAILVTGASRGIGAAIAEQLAEAGFIVGCLSRSGLPPQRPGASDEARARWIMLAGDVTDPEAIAAAVRNLAARHPLAGLVNNAGAHAEAWASEPGLDIWRAMIEANATSVVIGCQAVYPHLKDKGGLIVNLGSFFDRIGVKRHLGYCASKAAVGAITRVLAVEWARSGIRVLNVAPGYIVTDLNRAAMDAGPLREYLERRIPGGKPGRAEDVAALVASLFRIDSPFLTGETIYMDGAQGLAH